MKPIINRQIHIECNTSWWIFDKPLTFDLLNKCEGITKKARERLLGSWELSEGQAK